MCAAHCTIRTKLGLLLQSIWIGISFLKPLYLFIIRIINERCDGDSLVRTDRAPSFGTKIDFCLTTPQTRFTGRSFTLLKEMVLLPLQSWWIALCLELQHIQGVQCHWVISAATEQPSTAPSLSTSKTCTDKVLYSLSFHHHVYNVCS